MTQENALKLFKCLSDMSRLRIIQSLTQGDMYTELLAERPGAATVSVDWRTPAEPQNEDNLRDLSARRGVEPIRSLFRTKTFAAFLDSRDALPLSDRSALVGELFGLLGFPRRDARDSPAESESHAETVETAEP